MKKALILAAAAILMIACSKTPTAQISVKIDGAADTSVVLQKLNFNRLTPVDTIKTDAAGEFTYKVKLTGNAPYFYYLFYGEEPVASLVLLDGDKVNVKVDSFGLFKVEGSEESSLLKQVNDSFESTKYKINHVVDAIPENPTEAQAKEINSKVGKLYVDYKREATKYVITHPYSISSAVVLFQKFNENFPIFADDTDAILFKRTLDSLETVYPQSEYVLALKDEVATRQKYLDLSTKLSSVDLISFPDITMPDIKGEKKSLKDLEGNVIILSFWTVSQEEHKMFNQEMLGMYQRLHDKGLEIYQVGLDVDKPKWAAAVKSQNLPWINVNDGLGIESISLGLFNVESIPSMYVIGRDGNIIARDVFDVAALENLVKKAL